MRNTIIKLVFYMCVWYGSTNAYLDFSITKDAYVCIWRQNYLVHCGPFKAGRYVYKTPGPIGPIDGNYRPHTNDTYSIVLPDYDVKAFKILEGKIFIPQVRK